VNRTVVLADAAGSVRAFVKALFSREDLLFVEVADSTDAILAVYHHGPALIVLDVDLPTMGGLEVLARVREAGDAPVIMLSLHDHAPLTAACLARGADQVLLKPLDTARLVDCFEAALGARER
jgi:CheY-like chemotaxis protein